MEYDRFLKKLDNGELKRIMEPMRKLSELRIVDDSLVRLDSMTVATDTKQNNPKFFATDKLKPENHPKADLGCALGVHSTSNQHNEKRHEFY